ncbi:unnamed protein product, partial [Trichogramma brassicae]
YDAQRMNKVSIPGTQFGQNYWRAKKLLTIFLLKVYTIVSGGIPEPPACSYTFEHAHTHLSVTRITELLDKSDIKQKEVVGEDGAKNDEDLSMTILQEDYVHTELDLPEENSQILAGNIVSQLDQSFKMINSQVFEKEYILTGLVREVESPLNTSKHYAAYCRSITGSWKFYAGTGKKHQSLKKNLRIALLFIETLNLSENSKVFVNDNLSSLPKFLTLQSFETSSSSDSELILAKITKCRELYSCFVDFVDDFSDFFSFPILSIICFFLVSYIWSVFYCVQPLIITFKKIASLVDYGIKFIVFFWHTWVLQSVTSSVSAVEREVPTLMRN